MAGDAVAVARRKPALEHLTRMRDETELYVLARREIHRRLATVEDGLGNPRQADWERQRARAP